MKWTNWLRRLAHCVWFHRGKYMVDGTCCYWCGWCGIGC